MKLIETIIDQNISTLIVGANFKQNEVCNNNR